MAVWRRKPGSSVLVHSDQGSQFGSDDFRRFCRAQNLEPSMSRRGNCRDNAVAESFFSSLKKERIYTIRPMRVRRFSCCAIESNTMIALPGLLPSGFSHKACEALGPSIRRGSDHPDDIPQPGNVHSLTETEHEEDTSLLR